MRRRSKPKKTVSYFDCAALTELMTIKVAEPASGSVEVRQIIPKTVTRKPPQRRRDAESFLGRSASSQGFKWGSSFDHGAITFSFSLVVRKKLRGGHVFSPASPRLCGYLNC